ncbi:MAG: hypothetical protein EB060_11720, partial [Proteobacteria bacterium]|nr:hypothetical protein [Pseudomonadota bacterium]
GSTASDQVGSTSGGITALTNGNYVVASPVWDNGSIVNAGAATFCSGTTGCSGTVSATNSLVGSTASDQVGGGSGGITALTNGNYLVRSPVWDNGATVNAGAATFCSGTTGCSGTVSATNSLVGSTASDQVGSTSGGITALTNGNYVVASPVWDNGSGTTGVVGTINATNSVIGPSASAGLSSIVTDTVNNTYYTRFANAQKVYASAITGPTAGGGGGGGTLSDYDSFSKSPAADVSLAPSFLTATLNTGTNVTLQANNDITVADPVLANNPAGNGGSLTLRAGRSILVNASIATDGGDLSLLANEKLSAGVVDAYRDPGAAVVAMAAGTSLDAGTGAVTVRLDDGAGKTNRAAGDVTLRSITAGTLTAQNANSTGDLVLASGTLAASGTGTAITLASGRNVVNAAGAAALSAPNGRFLVYSTSPAGDTLGGLTGAFRRFSCAYGGSCPSFPAAGNGFLYAATPQLTATPAALPPLTYGDAAPALAGYGYTLSGYLGADAAADAVTGSLSGTTPYAAGSDVGTYAVTYASGALASSLGYGFTYASNPGGITVGQKTLTPSLLGAVVKPYDGDATAALAAGNYALAGLYGTDSVTLSAAGGSYDTKAVGTGKAVTFSGLSLAGPKAANYQLSA